MKVCSKLILLFLVSNFNCAVVLAQAWAMDEVADEARSGDSSSMGGILFVLLLGGLIYLISKICSYEKDRKEHNAWLENVKKQKAEQDQKKIEEAKQKEKRKEILAALYASEGVDLGLSVNWAKCNLDAVSEDEPGDLRKWGEVEYNSGHLCLSPRVLSDIGGDDRYDAATSIMGSKWRLPNRKEVQELIDKCTWEVESKNGKIIYKVIGPNGNSIYFPSIYSWMIGYCDPYGNGRYWISEPFEDYTQYQDMGAYCFFFERNQSTPRLGSALRECRFEIRAVCDKV